MLDKCMYYSKLHTSWYFEKVPNCDKHSMDNPRLCKIVIKDIEDYCCTFVDWI